MRLLEPSETAGLAEGQSREPLQNEGKAPLSISTPLRPGAEELGLEAEEIKEFGAMRCSTPGC
jgi:hypothetical protein